ncbi:hypothetical protein ANCDUO_11387 [Ancylostoma duodenale]|uniref:Reverse transcriptase domain-containing protein n=1 Tax=Ancylostoma duodenale TaxID=51022 RepID=A0A0C2D8B8_9BILA|nr:hypothetical protein ANCDUO_11387 [Ancylostoma duodenale]
MQGLHVDYRKAFDSIEMNSVLNAIIHAEVDPDYANILEQCNVGTTTTIQLFDKKFSKLFPPAIMSRLNWDDKGVTIGPQSYDSQKTWFLLPITNQR